MKSIDNLIFKFTNENRYAFYLSFFRVFVCLLLLKELAFHWRFVPLLYAGTSFLVPINTTVPEFFISLNLNLIRENIYPFLGIYLALLILLLFGVGKNVTAFFLFFFYDILQKLCPQILNGGDNFMRFILLYFCFANTFNFFSISKYRTQYFFEIRNFFSNLAGLSICIHLCFIYFISAIHKIHADVWFNGLATYYTLSLERFNGTPLNHRLAKNAVLVGLSTYSTWLIELFYPVLIWFRQTKKIIIILACLLHCGIAVFMMLYDFQLIFIFAQGFFISNTHWLGVFAKVKTRLSLLSSLRLQRQL